MKNKKFRKLSEIEKKAILCGVIAKKTKGKISKEDITYVVNSLDLNYQYTIKVITEAKEFARRVTLYQHGFTHPRGSEGVRQDGVCILGNVKFGLDRNWKHSDGRVTERDVQKIQPDFDVTKTAVVLLTENDWDSFDNSCSERRGWTILYFYIPENEPYKLDDNIKALIEAFDLE